MAAASSTPFFGIREEDLNQMKQQLLSSSNPASSAVAATAAVAPPQSTAPVKKKRNLPGTPYPDAEVIALSPKTLMATNRFICEVCNKGFQREQNLQLHRRGHNLPWKLKQKSTKEVRRKVYLCPEPSCIHHNPSRALGDLTGIKKHFCRKHGEKKWKCDKCSKRYAVQSDWKAHSKTCGTREYRCDCGTLFSRRDSFITHRAFCDALAQESARLPTSLTALSSHLYGANTSTNTMGLGLSQLTSHLHSLQQQQDQSQQHHPTTDLLRLSGGASQFDHLLSPSSNPSPFRLPPHSSPASAAFYLPGGNSSGSNNNNQEFSNDDSQSHHSLLQQSKQFHSMMQLPELQTRNNNNNNNNSSASSNNLFNLSFFSNGGDNNNSTTLFAGNLMNDHQVGLSSSIFNNSSVQNHESVLPQMSATALLQKAAQMGATMSSGNGAGGSSLLRRFGREKMRSQEMENATHIQDLMDSLANGSTSIFSGQQSGGGGGCYGGFSAKHGLSTNGGSLNGGSDGLTRDFLGVGSMVRGMRGGISTTTTTSQREQQHSGMYKMSPLDSEVKTAPSSFGGGSTLQ